MKRITVEMVKEAYAKTGLKPMQEVFYSDSGRCSCAIGAIYTAETGIQDELLAERYVRKLTNSMYVSGLINGFDSEVDVHNDNPYYLVGIDDGRAAWEAVKP